MKTTIEVNGYTIVIEQMEEQVQVSAMLEDDVVEEFTLEPMEDMGDEGEDLKGFKEFEEEEDFEEDMEEMEDDLEEIEDDEEEGAALESFQSFINKKKRVSKKRK